MKNQLIALAGAMMLTACASGSGSAPIQPLPQALRTGARVVSVNVDNIPERGVSAEFGQVFQTRVQTALNECATGQQPLTLEISLDTFDRANAAMTWLISDQNSIAGIARLKDSSGNLVGEYLIRRVFTAGGLVGIALMSQAEEQMSDAFGEELCKQAFGAGS
ncbi:hypothetical protein [Brevundimonas sp. GCM10030266]|uniref:hypothetical protein n=1 Tax=Brevundimonas sp. GCM10030266 TaxID=3273386 RepID=UPI0036143AB2